MPVHVKGFIAILVIGFGLILGYKFALPQLRDALQRATSDAAGTRGKLVIGMDSWIGYFPLCSPEMEKRVRGEGQVLRCEDDQADYATRFRRLADGELDFAVATVDAWLLNGAAADFPAAIVAVLDESKGGDAIVARRSAAASLDALKRNPGLRIAYTPGSPSEHLLKSIGIHFDLPQLRQPRGAWRVPATGSADALAKLQKNEVQVAVLWEPDVSRALADPQFVKLIGSEDTEQLIVDVLLASRRVLQERPEAVQILLRQYFNTLRHYGETPAQLRRDVAAATQLADAQVEAVLSGVRWATLNDNGAQWFGVTPSGLPAQQGLIETINSTVALLRTAGDFDHNPLPDQDPFRITNRQFIAELYLPQAAAGGGADSLTRPFAPLDEAGWLRLKEVGTLRIEPIGFARGTAALDDASRATLDAIAERLRHYPNYRLLIKGHTGTGGDAEANVELSKQRAQAAADYFLSTRRVDAQRVRALGYGGSRPLPRAADESDRVYAYRLPRVEFALLAEAY